MTTAFLGPRGTFSEEAALLYGPDDAMIALASFPALTAAVETGLADVAVMPIENSIEGPVATTLDLLIHETPLKICAEIVVPVRHFLITAPGVNLADIKVVTSHPQALGQCRKFLERCLPGVDQVAALSTAGAVEEVSKGNDFSRAAIGPARAGELYGGAVLARDIQDVHANVTRFVALAAKDSEPTGDDKTSIGFRVKSNVPGVLSRALAPFSRENLQLTKIESRPTKAWLGDYVFLLDFEGHRLDAAVQRALAEVAELSAELNVFGSYPRFKLESLEMFADSRAN